MGVVEVAKEEKINGFDKWEVESWSETLITAKEILGNPKKVAAVKKVLAKTVKAAKQA